MEKPYSIRLLWSYLPFEQRNGHHRVVQVSVVTTQRPGDDGEFYYRTEEQLLQRKLQKEFATFYLFWNAENEENAYNIYKL